MNKILLINDDYLGHVERIRHCARGIVIEEGKVLLSYLSNTGYYMIPGGGVEEGESLAKCCERELLEETGIIVRAKEEIAEIEELFDIFGYETPLYGMFNTGDEVPINIILFGIIGIIFLILAFTIRKKT